MQNAMKQSVLKYIYSIKNLSQIPSGLGQWYISTSTALGTALPTAWGEVCNGGDVLAHVMHTLVMPLFIPALVLLRPLHARNSKERGASSHMAGLMWLFSDLFPAAISLQRRTSKLMGAPSKGGNSYANLATCLASLMCCFHGN